MPAVYIRTAARRDLVGHFVYLAENASFDIADHYLSSAETSFTGLAQHPMIGSLLSPHRPELTGMRKWRVKDFDNFLILYLPRHDGVSIVRVLHAAQDWWKLLGMET